MGSATPVRDELNKLQALLTGEDVITTKQRFALMVSHAAITWMLNFKTDKATEPPSSQIMRSVPLPDESAANQPASVAAIKAL